jgi:hypothetical protein
VNTTRSPRNTSTSPSSLSADFISRIFVFSGMERRRTLFDTSRVKKEIMSELSKNSVLPAVSIFAFSEFLFTFSSICWYSDLGRTCLMVLRLLCNTFFEHCNDATIFPSVLRQRWSLLFSSLQVSAARERTQILCVRLLVHFVRAVLTERRSCFELHRTRTSRDAYTFDRQHSDSTAT